MRIGSLKNARLIAEFRADVSFGERAPDGWKHLGSGWSRYAFLAPDGVVYKVGYNYVNRDERHNISLLSKIEHPTIKVPACTTWTIKNVPSKRSREDFTLVNAMEFIEGKMGHPGNDDIWKIFGVEDGFGGNFIQTNTGLTYLIDLGETRKRLRNGKIISDD